ncbi:discoidin domain-containing protein [Sinomicrobium soli]|uniref:discoidin domain-containing protein n=1 Tax=Sinomicrobium sp. N-1-3-6 TaxID=2219864 RepID=UPI000DCD8203|nr:discoidin domain-containing protein [Sinomicrobium sp. N-1-3-6]RAV27416.1 hypothetical protein DN748_18755 [Sinomicrobium sp. N-1-3-6]
MSKNYLLIFIVLLLIACHSAPEEVREALESAKDNRPELEKVITHYQQQDDTEKLEAAYYLIGNMDGRYYWDGEIVTAFDSLFRYMDSLHRAKRFVPPESPFVKKKWAALTDLYGMPAYRYAEKYSDSESLTSEYLISQIDQAFKIRDSLPWGKQLTFEEFCHYLLPYRIGTERPESWNRHVFDEYREFRKDITGESRRQVAERLFTHLQKRTRVNQTLHRYPFDMPESLMRTGRRGICRHLVYYKAMVMRANGLPVDVDFVPLWGNRSGGHYWNVLLQEDGNRFRWPDAPKGLSYGNYDKPRHTLSKVYRETFALQPAAPDSEDIPPSLRDRNRIDVTHEYTRVFDVEIPLKFPAIAEKEYAVICTFNTQRWEAQAYGEIKRGHVTFKQMGARVLYLVMYYHEGELVPASDPFVLKEDGTIAYIVPEGLQDMTLLRKFPRFPTTEKYEKRLIGARFQGANRADFRDAVNLYTIKTPPDSIAQALISHPGRFRYVRLLAGEKTLNVAELEFYGENGIHLTGRAMGFPKVNKYIGTPYQLAFDGDPGTYFHVPPNKKSAPAWAGLDLGEPRQLTKVRFAPRSDTNFILVGDTYELCYWDKDHWVSLGKQVADKQKLLYRQVPADGLYLLHNLTKGREERIFTYEHGKQIWW